MNLTGNLVIGAHERRATAGAMRALHPARQHDFAPDFAFDDIEEVDRAAQLADEAFDSYNNTSLSVRASFLEHIADGLDANATALARRAALETGLPATQLEAEAAKAATQFRQIATVVRQGRFLQVTIDSAQPERQPSRRMDYRMQKIGLGPIAIFGASNFPISYSVAGGNTASALAAGCPVILKVHSAHPGVSEIILRIIQQTAKEAGLHEGVFSLLRGDGNAISEALVDHSLIKGIAFTGSEAGNMQLYRRAQRRPYPIPVFTEMTGVNPVFVLPSALYSRGAAIGHGFAERMQVNVAQACLNPAILLAIRGVGYGELRQAMIARVTAMRARTMLTPGVHLAYGKNVDRQFMAGATQIAAGADPERDWDGQSLLLEVGGARLLAQPALLEDVFGPATLLVRVKDEDQLVAIARRFRGQLSATMHLDPADHALAARLLPILERRTDRIVVNAFVQPQDVSYASSHGTPFPATSDSRFMSVGMSAIERFLRPVCYQGFPDELLPQALRHDKPLGLLRLTDGELLPASGPPHSPV